MFITVSATHVCLYLQQSEGCWYKNGDVRFSLVPYFFVLFLFPVSFIYNCVGMILAVGMRSNYKNACVSVSVSVYATCVVL